jgi:short-subunit dehydrogenase
LEEVVEYGFENLMKNKAIAVQGLLNSIVASTSGLVPRSLLRKIVMKLQKKRN